MWVWVRGRSFTGLSEHWVVRSALILDGGRHVVRDDLFLSRSFSRRCWGGDFDDYLVHGVDLSGRSLASQGRAPRRREGAPTLAQLQARPICSGVSGGNATASVLQAKAQGNEEQDGRH